MYDWDDVNTGHIARHGVEPEEAEEALEDPERIPTRAYNTPAEKRRAYIGEAVSGRLLTVVFTERKGKTRVLMARPADRSERRRYYNAR